MAQQGQTNSTAALEALSPWLDNPGRIVFQVEVLVVAAAALLLLQLVLCSCRRQSGSTFVQVGAWVSYTMSFPLVTYTLGMMQSSPVKNVLYPVWAVSLFLVAGSTNVSASYDLDDNKRWKRHLLELFQYALYSGMNIKLLLPSYGSEEDPNRDKSSFAQHPTGRLKSVTPVIMILNLIILFTNAGRVISCWRVGVDYSTKRVAEFMKKQAGEERPSVFDTGSLEGYRYPICCSKLRFTTGDVLTVDKIWQSDCMLLKSDYGKTLKDVCLSFALFKLLRRRYHGMLCAEAGLPETMDFVLKGLLSTQDGYLRAFRIVEVELGFYHDYLFTRYNIIRKRENIFFGMWLVRLILISVILGYVSQNSLAVLTPAAIIEVQTKSSDTVVTLAVLSTIILVEVLQATFYLASDWGDLSLALKCATSNHRIGTASMERIIVLISRFSIFKRWSNEIGQRSAILDSQYFAKDLQCITEGPPHLFTSLSVFSTKRSPLRISSTLKESVARSLKLSAGVLSNGKSSLRRNGVLEQFSWALNGGNQTEIVLIWHIATEYCELAQSDAVKSNQISQHEHNINCDDRELAVSLSRYCAYLIDSASELLPDYMDSEIVIAGIMTEVRNVVGSRSNHGKYVAMKGVEEEEEGSNMFRRCIKLGKQLEGLEDSTARRWKVMADFWAETILYIAPSDNVRGHLDHLARGGQFLTHIWALLTHTGVLKIDTEDRHNRIARQQSEGNV